MVAVWRIAVLALFVSLSVVAAQAQTTEGYLPAQLEQLLAPIALYPDPLLVQVLEAAAYPEDIMDADRWLHDPANASLSGDQMTASLQQAPWDASVKALCAFPQILHNLSYNIQWTNNVGDAFRTEPSEVMKAVQSLRQIAVNNGNLQSTSQETVSEQGPYILIEPTDPYGLYVPSYDPATAYGPWPHQGFPPYYFTNPGYVSPPVVVVVSTLFFHRFWNRQSWNWTRERDERADIRQQDRPATGHQEHEEDDWRKDRPHDKNPGAPVDRRAPRRTRAQQTPTQKAAPTTNRMVAPPRQEHENNGWEKDRSRAGNPGAPIGRRAPQEMRAQGAPGKKPAPAGNRASAPSQQEHKNDAQGMVNH